MENQLCSKCKKSPRFSTYNSYCRSCKNGVDLKSYHGNKAERRKYQKEYLNKNPDKKSKYRELSKKWFESNPGYMNEWMKAKRENNVDFKLNHYLTSRLHSSLKGKTKQFKLTWLLGCSLLQLKEHLEKQFDESMNWDNYGEWHIDHIKPVKLFNIEDKDQLKECWNYKNLQPLWAKDNLKKSATYIK